MSSLNDDHYQGKVIESMDHQEHLIETLVNVPLKQRYAIASAAKYINRAGNKKGSPWEDDIIKAINFLFRAVRPGKWVGSVVDPDVFFGRESQKKTKK